MRLKIAVLAPMPKPKDEDGGEPRGTLGGGGVCGAFWESDW
jgi:hypothetical protein